MNRITASRARLDHAAGLPALLDAAYDAFEAILAVLRHHEERAGNAFPAFVLAAGAAASGRDWIAGAPSLPPAATPPQPAAAGDDLLTGHDWVHVAIEIAGISQALAGRLAAAGAEARDPEDRAACEQAAGYAARIRALLAGARQP